MADTDYNDSHRAFLQAFMARSCMTFREAQPVLAAILSVHEGRSVDPDDITQEHLASYISEANAAISPFNFEIRSSLRQSPKPSNPDAQNVTPERVYALVNVHVDNLTQLATTYSADEIAFVKRILDYIFDTNNTRLCEAMVISAIQAIQLAKVSAGRRSTNADSTQNQGGAAQSLSMTQAETMMRSLVEEGWLEKNSKGNYSLTPRAVMELRDWLRQTYNSDEPRVLKIKDCAACKDIITVGQRCANRDCIGRLHDHCIRNFFRMQQAEKCPVCQLEWPGDRFVGERAVTAANRRQSSNVPRMSEAPSTAPNGHDEENDVEDEG